MQLMGFAAGMLAQATSGAPAASGTQVVAGGQIHSVWDFVIKGGPTMVVIGLCSLVALTIIVERLIVLRRRWVIPPNFLSGLKALANDPPAALEYCRVDGSPMANIIAAAIRRRGERPELVEKAVEDAGRREIVALRQRMRVLGALPQVSTMLGLLGTIFGMIKTFQAVAASGQSLGKTELLAQGIFEAWTCTAAGLLVAIPVLVMYHFLLGRIDSLLAQMEAVAVDWVELQTRGPNPAAVEMSRATAPVTAPAHNLAPQALTQAPAPPASVAVSAGGSA